MHRQCIQLTDTQNEKGIEETSNGYDIYDGCDNDRDERKNEVSILFESLNIVTWKKLNPKTYMMDIENQHMEHRAKLLAYHTHQRYITLLLTIFPLVLHMTCIKALDSGCHWNLYSGVGSAFSKF